jgi:8-oxo-dGTP pyrophosphatase MutT (NUDIX family)
MRNQESREPALATTHQAGVIAYRNEDGQRQVLLITSRDTHRWIVPKGNIERGKTAREAAAIEAFEEAGLDGTIASEIPIGFYTYFKRRRDQTTYPVSVEVYLMQVERQRKKWPEKGKRELCWLTIEDAIAKIEEPGVVPLLKRLGELPEFRPAKASEKPKRSKPRGKD